MAVATPERQAAVEVVDLEQTRFASSISVSTSWRELRALRVANRQPERRARGGLRT